MTERAARVLIDSKNQEIQLDAWAKTLGWSTTDPATAKLVTLTIHNNPVKALATAHWLVTFGYNGFGQMTEISGPIQQ